MKTHELIDKPEKWLKEMLCSSFPANKEQHIPLDVWNNCSVDSPEAFSFCIRGGAMKVCGGDNKQWQELENEICRKLGFANSYDMVYWNNSPDLTFEQFHAKLVEHDI